MFHFLGSPIDREGGHADEASADLTIIRISSHVLWPRTPFYSLEGEGPLSSTSP
jgi:hypothetical protein